MELVGREDGAGATVVVILGGGVGATVVILGKEVGVMVGEVELGKEVGVMVGEVEFECGMPTTLGRLFGNNTPRLIMVRSVSPGASLELGKIKVEQRIGLSSSIPMIPRGPVQTEAGHGEGVTHSLNFNRHQASRNSPL